jgi:hypothetical protein
MARPTAAVLLGATLWLLVGVNLATRAEGPAIAPKPVIRLLDGHYDGMRLTGILLVGATEGTVLVPAWPLESSEFTVDGVRDCKTRRGVRYWVSDWVGSVGQRPAPVPVRAGYWYGKEVSYALFHKAGPDCIEIMFSLHLATGEPATKLRVKLNRINRKSSRPTGTSGERAVGPKDKPQQPTPH